MSKKHFTVCGVHSHISLGNETKIKECYIAFVIQAPEVADLLKYCTHVNY